MLLDRAGARDDGRPEGREKPVELTITPGTLVLAAHRKRWEVFALAAEGVRGPLPLDAWRGVYVGQVRADWAERVRAWPVGAPLALTDPAWLPLAAAPLQPRRSSTARARGPRAAAR